MQAHQLGPPADGDVLSFIWVLVGPLAAFGASLSGMCAVWGSGRRRYVRSLHLWWPANRPGDLALRHMGCNLYLERPWGPSCRGYELSFEFGIPGAAGGEAGWQEEQQKEQETDRKANRQEGRKGGSREGMKE